MTFPNALFLTPSQWRANREETPCGGLTPMGVHAVDGMIDLCGAIDQVYCQSFRRVVEIDADDTTSMLFRMKDGMSGYLGTMTATGPGFSFQVFGSDGLGAARGDDARRRRVVRGAADAPLRHLQVPAAQGPGGGLGGRAVRRRAARRSRRSRSPPTGGPAFPIPIEEMVHGAAVTEAVVRSAASGAVESRHLIRTRETAWISATVSVI